MHGAMVNASEGRNPRITRSRTMKALLAAAALTAITFANPAQAASQADVEALMKIVEATGTSVSLNTNHFDKSCLGRAAYYTYEEDVEDILVVCTDHVDTNDPDAMWEAIAHEATHVAQACQGGPAVADAYRPRMYRELQTMAPHYSKQVTQDYASDDQLVEVEAFWMELQHPTFVMEFIVASCTKN